MKRIPWRTLEQPDPEHRYVVSVGVFVLDRVRLVPRFLLHTLRVRRVARRTDGLVGYALIARFPRTFTEISAFESPEAMRRFVAAPRHAAAIRTFRPHLGRGSKIVTAEIYGRDLPLKAADVTARLEGVPGLGEFDGPPRHPLDRGGSHVPAGAHAGPPGAVGPPA